MKKILTLLVIGLVTFSMAADDDELGYRAAGISTESLYPEGNFDVFPSQLTTLERDLLQINPEIALNSLDKDVWTIPVGAVNEGATFTIRDRDMSFGIDGMYFTALSEDLTFGFTLDTDLSFDTMQNQKDDGYTTAGETQSIIRRDNNYTITPTVFFAFDLGELTAGFRVYSYNYFDTASEEFRQTTDSLVNNGEMYYTAGNTRAGGNNNRITGAFSVGQDTDDLSWSVSANGSFRSDNVTNYRAVDSSGLGAFGDTIMTEEEYRMTPVAQGGLGAAFYSEKDNTVYYSAKVNAFAKMVLDDGNSLILGLNWTPLDITKATTYARNATADLDETTNTQNEGLLTGGINVAYDMKLSQKSSLRLGTGVSVYHLKESNEDLDVLGITNYNLLNTDRFSEVNWAADPANGAVIAAAGFADNTLAISMPLSVEFRFMPSDRVTLFSALSGYIAYWTNTYNVFNTADNTVWTENSSNFGFDISSLELVGGIDFMVNDSLSILMGTSLNPFSTQVNIAGDPLPNIGGVDTTDVTADNNTSSNGWFQLDLTATFRY